MSNPTQTALSLIGGKQLRLATCWEITRADGTQLRFTDHNGSLTHGGDVYNPTDGISSSAHERRDDVRGGNVDTVGLISDSRITTDDLRSGLYRKAVINEYIIDWRYPFLDPIQHNVWYLLDTKFNGDTWEGSVNSLTYLLAQNIGDSFTRSCRNNLGDGSGAGTGYCTWDIEVDGALDAVTNHEGGRFTGPIVDSVTDRRTFTLDTTALGATNQFSGAKTPADFFDFGILTWTSGANSGMTFDVLDSQVNADPLMQDIKLFLSMPYDAVAGDACKIYVGCDRIFGTCGTKFDLVADYQGFPYMPGLKKILFTPDRV